MNEATNEFRSMRFSALLSPGWQRWNEETWGLRPLPLEYQPSGLDGPRLSGLLYTTRRGRVRQPPLNPYLPVSFTATTTRLDKSSQQWIDCADLLAEDIKRLGLHGRRIVVNPGITDGRPFTWAGFRVLYGYTYTTALPYDLGRASPSVRSRVKKAKKAGLKFEVSDDYGALADCLAATEQRKGFRYRLGASDIRLLAESLGQVCRTQLVRTRDGKVVSGGVRIAEPGGTAIGLVQGTTAEGLALGASQLMQAGALADATAMGCVSYDYGGANIRSVAAAKSRWGMQLTSYLILESITARSIAADSRLALRSLRFPKRSE